MLHKNNTSVTNVITGFLGPGITAVVSYMKISPRMVSMLQRTTLVFIALLLTVFLLAFPPNGYIGIHGFKYAAFLVICGGYVLVIAVVRIMHAVKGVQPIGKNSFMQLPLAVKCLIGFLFFTILSALFSSYPGAFLGGGRQEGALTIVIYVMCCVFVSLYFKPHKWMIYLLGIVTVFTNMLALVQLTGRNPFNLYPGGFNFHDAGVHYGGEFLSTIGNSGLYAGFLVIVIGVFALALTKFEEEIRWLAAVPFFLCVLVAFAMQTDAALMAILVGTVLIIPVAATNRKALSNMMMVFAIILGAFALSRVLIFQAGPVGFAPVPVVLVAGVGVMALVSELVMKISLFEMIPARWYRIGAAVVMFGSIAIALVYLWTYSGGPGGIIYEASQVLRGNWEDDFGNHRIFIWREVLERIRWGTLLLGTGPDTMVHWDIPPFVRHTDYFTVISRIDSAHNEFLHVLAMGGLLSLAAYLGAVLTALFSWVRRPDNALSAMSGAGVLFYLIQSVFGISHFSSAPFFWVCLGVLVNADVQKHS